MRYVDRPMLEDRWHRISVAMRGAGLDALVLIGRGKIGQYGNIHYVSGHFLHSVHGYAVMFPGEPPVLVMGQRDQLFAKSRGAGDLLSGRRSVDMTGTNVFTPGAPPLAQELCRVLTSHPIANKTVGLVGLQTLMPVEDYLSVTQTLADVKFVDGSRPFAQVKAIKTEAEIPFIEEAYAVADAGYRRFEEVLAVGKTEWEVCAEIERTTRALGALQSYNMALLGGQYPRYPTERVLQQGDLVGCYVEVAMASGYWVEKGGMMALGKPADEDLELYRAAQRAMKGAEDKLMPGNKCADVARVISAEANQKGYRIGIWNGHGVGVDHDIPVIAESDNTVLQEGMVFSMHPHMVDAADVHGAFVAEQYLIRKDGAYRFSKIEPELVWLG
ncbi:MAG: aminopeptidase P family protein [Chloroflexi bacterium]|nr:aminopeptidase P family protein [Chloroflexota bacterium]